MSQNKLPEEADRSELIVDYVVHQYGLTRDQAREVVRQSAGDQAMIDAEAGRLKAQKRP